MKSEFEYVNWARFKSKLILMYPVLTKSDLIWRNGTVNDMLEMISVKLGKTTKELQQEIEKF